MDGGRQGGKAAGREIGSEGRRQGGSARQRARGSGREGGKGGKRAHAAWRPCACDEQARSFNASLKFPRAELIFRCYRSPGSGDERNLPIFQSVYEKFIHNETNRAKWPKEASEVVRQSVWRLQNAMCWCQDTMASECLKVKCRAGQTGFLNQLSRLTY